VPSFRFAYLLRWASLGQWKPGADVPETYTHFDRERQPSNGNHWVNGKTFRKRISYDRLRAHHHHVGAWKRRREYPNFASQESSTQGWQGDGRTHLGPCGSEEPDARTTLKRPAYRKAAISMKRSPFRVKPHALTHVSARARPPTKTIKTEAKNWKTKKGARLLPTANQPSRAWSLSSNDLSWYGFSWSSSYPMFIHLSDMAACDAKQIESFKQKTAARQHRVRWKASVLTRVSEYMLGMDR